MLTLDQISDRVAKLGINPDVHVPRFTASVLALELTGDAVTDVRRIDPAPDGEEPTDANRIGEEAVAETTLVFATAGGAELTYKPGASRKGASFN